MLKTLQCSLLLASLVFPQMHAHSAETPGETDTVPVTAPVTVSTTAPTATTDADTKADSDTDTDRNDTGDTAAEAATGTDTTAQASLLDQIIAVQSAFTTAQGSIVYKIVYTKDPDRSPEVYQAKLSVETPNKYHFLLKKEDQLEHFISDGTIEWHVEDVDGYKIASKKELKDDKGKFAAITDYIPLRREQLEKQFHLSAQILSDSDPIKATQKTAQSVLNLEPLTADQKDHIQWGKIYFDKDGKTCAIQILDADSNLYDISIESMQYNVTIDPATFSYTEEP